MSNPIIQPVFITSTNDFSTNTIGPISGKATITIFVSTNTGQDVSEIILQLWDNQGTSLFSLPLEMPDGFVGATSGSGSYLDNLIATLIDAGITNQSAQQSAIDTYTLFVAVLIALNNSSVISSLNAAGFYITFIPISSNITTPSSINFDSVSAFHPAMQSALVTSVGTPYEGFAKFFNFAISSVGILLPLVEPPPPDPQNGWILTTAMNNVQNMLVNNGIVNGFRHEYDTFKTTTQTNIQTLQQGETAMNSQIVALNTNIIKIMESLRID